ncbi:trace amine-associated receptor 13c-like [Polypterus senegalus]|uniref:trace amine-associated receptor 13c-like n=1 Tax=Polypterus senegalus TaxID=55291 RepID=UPI001963E73D|nr:trace amine-associated receptor 13c-like [Polypterus senegalus]
MEASHLPPQSTVWNGNTSGSTSLSKKNQITTISVFVYLFSACFVILTVSGNLIVIISISHFKQLHTPSNVLVLSLAVADFFIGIFSFPFLAIKTIENCWNFGDIFCFVYNLIGLSLTSVSISNLVFIAVDRYFAVCDPLLYSTKITVYVASVFTAISWLFSLLYTLIILNLNEIGTLGGDEGCRNDCFVMFSANFVIIDLIVTFIMPYSLMISLYLNIFIVARRHARAIRSMEQNQNCMVGIKKNISTKSERKAAKTLGIVMAVFVFCWVPYYICYLIDSFLNISAPAVVKNVLVWLAYFNSCLNPVIYAFFYPWFQKSLKLIVTCEIFAPASSLINLFVDS